MQLKESINTLRPWPECCIYVTNGFLVDKVGLDLKKRESNKLPNSPSPELPYSPIPPKLKKIEWKC